MRSFLDYIQFKYIPCDVLVKDVYPLKIVPNYTMIRALAHQADPTLQVYNVSVELLLILHFRYTMYL